MSTSDELGAQNPADFATLPVRQLEYSSLSTGSIGYAN